MASTILQKNIAREDIIQDLQTYFVFHINRGMPEELHVDSVQAPCLEEARRVAERLFPTNAILQVRIDGKDAAAPDMGSYPSARFINGRFHGAVFDEDEMEFDG